MTRYIIRRLLQGVLLLFLISVVVFVLANEMGDPLASFGGRRRIRSSDRERLTRQLGLDKPLAVQYLVWLIGNDWMEINQTRYWTGIGLSRPSWRVNRSRSDERIRRLPPNDASGSPISLARTKTITLIKNSRSTP